MKTPTHTPALHAVDVVIDHTPTHRTLNVVTISGPDAEYYARLIPAACNSHAAKEFYHKANAWAYKAYLLAEPDCLPLSETWIKGSAMNTHFIYLQSFKCIDRERFAHFLRFVHNSGVRAVLQSQETNEWGHIRGYLVRSREDAGYMARHAVNFSLLTWEK